MLRTPLREGLGSEKALFLAAPGRMMDEARDTIGRLGGLVSPRRGC